MLFKFAMTSATLALQGKLVRDWGFAIRQGVIGTAIGAGLFAGSFLLGAPLLVSTVLAAGVTGFITPILFKDLKAA
ncbi:MAG: hypothetical protein AAF658_21665 [Myxococcota bacterium]